MPTVVLAESRRGGKVAVIERINDDYGYMYRVVVSERFRALSKAQEAFLAAAPRSMSETLSKQIADNNKSPSML